MCIRKWVKTWVLPNVLDLALGFEAGHLVVLNSIKKWVKIPA